MDFKITSILKYYCSFLLFFNFVSLNILASCLVYDSNNYSVDSKADALFTELSKSLTCPLTVQDFRTLLKNNEYNLNPTMVANEGAENPINGSFSFFEHAQHKTNKKSDLLFGYFTQLNKHTLRLLNSIKKDVLIIEVISWDNEQNIYNFYELRGTGKSARWYYRGNSLDAVSDNTYLYRESRNGAQQKFGTRMRCSACHNAGAPIMKEIRAPYNDWWKLDRTLQLLPNKADLDVMEIMSELNDAEYLAHTVKNNIKKLTDSPTYQAFLKQQDLQVQLRPLFCNTEINIESDYVPLKSDQENIYIPSKSIINPLLYTSKDISIKKDIYLDLLKKYNLQFPNNNQNDAVHAWLAPVISHQNITDIENILAQKIASKNFVLATLLYDYTTPLFSHKRCDLLKMIPNTAIENWEDDFIQRINKLESQLRPNLTHSQTSSLPTCFLIC